MATKPSKRSPKHAKQPNNRFNQQGGDPPMQAEKEVERQFAAQHARQSKQDKK